MIKLKAMRLSKTSSDKSRKSIDIPQQINVPKMPPVQPPKKSRHEG